MVSKGNLNVAQKEYVAGKENAFADFLSRKYEVDQTDTNHPTTSKAAEAMDFINVVETRAKTREKLAMMPQTDLKAPEIPEEDKIVDPPDLPNQDQWPFTQQQIVHAQKVDPTLDQTRQKVENQMQSPAGASCGGMSCKRSYVDPIIPTHKWTLQSNRHFHNSDINHKRIAQFLHFDRYFETTFNCLVSMVYNPVCVTDAMVPDIIKNL
uniref:Uncharacterized protein n=1 Tax=Romanomermis culicivorax TaxID=13658 RepID=A0A915KKH0_ROMCU